MTISRKEKHHRLRQEKAKEAISLAMESRWEEAVAVNRLLLQLAPDDVDASNRLGKAWAELWDLEAAQRAFHRSLELSPHNTIARKNLERLSQMKEAPPRRAHGRRLTPDLFIEESGKTTQVTLQDTPPTAVLVSLSAGTPLDLHPHGDTLEVSDVHGQRLGLMPPALGRRLLHLMSGGNQYQAAVAGVDGDRVTVVLRESFQHPSQRGIISFPAKESFSSIENGLSPFDGEDDEEVEWMIPPLAWDDEAPETGREAALDEGGEDSEDGLYLDEREE